MTTNQWNAERIAFALLMVVAAVMLLWAQSYHRIGYYTILRLVVCTACAYGLYLTIKSKRVGWAFPFGALIVLFNPLVNLRITREMWSYIDVVTAIFLVATIFFITVKSEQAIPETLASKENP
jgi:glucan phosphoethanolaminetransferase (alkaline phosphatase superfamily)